METARLKLQGFYSLLAGAILLLGVPLYQTIVLAPAGYLGPANTAFIHGQYGSLLLWISNHSSSFIVFRLLEIIPFLLLLRLPLALYRTQRARGRTLARWMLVGGLGGLGLFAAMIALSTITFINTATSYSQAAPGSATAQNILNSFKGFYDAEALGQNTLGGFLVAIFLVCTSLLIARSGKLSNLLVYFGLLAAALMAALALLFAVSPPDAQTQLNTPALASFAVWLIWLGILLMQRAGRLVTEAAPPDAPSDPAPKAGAPDEESAGEQSAQPGLPPLSSTLEATPPTKLEPPAANASSAQ